MKKAAIAAAIALMVAGCAHAPMKQHQVNRTNKTDKGNYNRSAKVITTAPMPTPNQTVQKRWFPKFKIRWLHPK
jgi:PBP1b-binding outer membrane lipoprotein LpoB